MLTAKQTKDFISINFSSMKYKPLEKAAFCFRLKMEGVKASTLIFAVFATFLLFDYVKTSRFESIKNDLKEGEKLSSDATSALEAVFSDSHSKYNKDLNKIKGIAKHADSNLASYAQKLENKIEKAAHDEYFCEVLLT
ncbi:unnamed protein product [Larinioides sclopetarius]|uniref:Uncharacterized protein n=1 Tax=Larinioides sclopetarius TaxID=280406 RepID=A0AAV1ZSF0_9ARAC